MMSSLRITLITDDDLTETIIVKLVKCPPSGQEVPPGSAQEEDRVVVHTSEDEMDWLCWGPMDAGTMENQEEEVQMAAGGCHKVNHRVMYLEKLNDIVQVH